MGFGKEKAKEVFGSWYFEVAAVTSFFVFLFLGGGLFTFYRGGQWVDPVAQMQLYNRVDGIITEIKPKVSGRLFFCLSNHL